MNLNPEQQAAVDRLVAQGWARESAEMMVLETTPDVIDGPPPADEEGYSENVGGSNSTQ